MNAPALEVLQLQAPHLRNMADTLREHIATHRQHAAGAAERHLATAMSYCEAANLLARFIESCLLCAIEAQKPLPVCAGDGKRDPKPDSGDDPRYVGPEYDKYEADERRGA